MRLAPVFVVLFGYFFTGRCEHFEIHSRFPGGACILLDINATFNLTYTKGHRRESSPQFNLKGAKVAETSSKCGNEIIGSTSVLSVSLFPTQELLMFTFTRKNGKVEMSVRFSLDPSKHFRNITTSGTVEMNVIKPLLVGPDSPNSYRCISEEYLMLKSSDPDSFSMTMASSNLHVQAYRIRNNHFSPAIECPQDLMSSTIQPETTTQPQPETTTHQETNSTTEPQPETTTHHETNTTTEPQPETTTHHETNTTTEPQPETTTHHETNMTTEPKPETTTHHETKTTTEPKPETTTEPPETTTNRRNESTTTAPETETTTSMTPTTTEPPYTGHKYVVRNKKEVCIVLQGDIMFEIPYQTKNGKTGTKNITIPDSVKVTGSCSYKGSESSQELTLTFFNTSWILDIVIAKEKQGTREQHVLSDSATSSEDYSWQQLSLSYVIDYNFPDAKTPGQNVTVQADGTAGKFKANTAESYKCNAKQDLELGKDKRMKIDLSKMQYRAFGTTESTDFPSSGVLECPADNSNNNKGGNHKTLGIALGCSLAALVLIVVGACLVVRYRRNKADQMSYDPIQ